VFLEKLLPSEGLYCVALLLPAGGFRHFFHSELPAAQAQINALNDAGNTVYISQATFTPSKIAEALAHNSSLPKGAPRGDKKKQRSQDNTWLMKNFFLDIDCGEKWPLKNQQEGKVALEKFIAETGLPFPAVVNSGNGLYAHWILTEAIPTTQWQTIARLLKKVVAEYSPAIGGDASRTSDSASVLRPPGTTNRKPGKEPKPVVLIEDAEPVPFMDFVRLLSDAAKKRQINRTATLPPVANTDLNADFYAGLERKDVPADAHKIAERCAQIRLVRDTLGDVSEPLWYAAIGVLALCEDGDDIIQLWSTGHRDYCADHTRAKTKQWHDAKVGPSTCFAIGGHNAAGCVGCKHNGKIKSPIVLGRPEPAKVEIPIEQCDAPEGFRRGADGLYAQEGELWTRFYDCDLYPNRLAYDESLGYEVMTLRHHLPHEGSMECILRSSVVNDPKALLTALSDNHIKVVGVKEKKYMTMYLESYAAKLQRQRSMSRLLCQMGWNKNPKDGKPVFVLGRKVFYSDGTVQDSAMARNVPKSALGFHAAGDLEKWSEATRLLDAPGMEPHAFALLAGGFGAPLMKFTGFDGALVSLIGESGSGKTLMLRWIQSVWGYHNDLMMLRDDTKNALVSRLGVYGNLPLTVDEITNIDGMELSDLVYRITQGRDKARLTKSAEERKVLNAWNTLAVTTSNTSLVDKLSGAKHDASAEINRVFEYLMMEHPAFKEQVTTGVYWTLHENYGHAGEAYAKWLVANIETIKPSLEKIREKLTTMAGIKGEERFWGAVASASIYGGLVAQRLGLVRFNVGRIMEWAAETIGTMRGDKGELASDSVGILGQFIDEHAAQRLLVKGEARGGQQCIIIDPPRGALVMRHESDTHRLFISRAVLKQWIGKKFGSYTHIKNDLIACKALVNPNLRKTLGGGTFYGGAQQVCWEINLKCPKLGPAVREMVEISEALAKAPLESDALAGLK
jgi:hypothetical protein